jgi:hypothetical protein
MPTAITSSGITFDDATTQTTSATKAGGIGTTQLANAAVTAEKLNGAQTGAAPVYGCRAWVNFNGTRNATDTGASTNGANVLIRASGNVSSVLKNGTGDYTITFTTAMPDANYAVSGSTQIDSSGNDSNSWILGVRRGSNNPATASCRVGVFNHNNNSAQDANVISVVFFR